MLIFQNFWCPFLVIAQFFTINNYNARILHPPFTQLNAQSSSFCAPFTNFSHKLSFFRPLYATFTPNFGFLRPLFGLCQGTAVLLCPLVTSLQATSQHLNDLNSNWKDGSTYVCNALCSIYLSIYLLNLYGAPSRKLFRGVLFRGVPSPGSVKEESKMNSTGRLNPDHEKSYIPVIRLDVYCNPKQQDIHPDGGWAHSRIQTWKINVSNSIRT